MTVKPKAKRIIIICIAVLVVAVLLAVGIFSIIMAVVKNPNKDWTNQEDVKFIAHRGLSSLYYENTEEAFIGAAESDFFYGIETDIWLTGDGVWVCAHNNNPFEDERKLISEISLSEAIELPLLNQPDFEGEHFICTFEKYLEICFESGKVPIIEIKSEYSISELNGLLEIVKQHSDLKNVQFISFKKKNIDRLYSLNEKLKLQLLIHKRNWNSFYALNMGYNIAALGKIVSKRMVDLAHANNSTLNVWTINDATQAKKFIALGVDYITTDCIFEL